MVIIIVIRLMVVKSVMVIGMVFSVLFCVYYVMICMGIISVIKLMVVRFVWRIGLELNVECIVKL